MEYYAYRIMIRTDQSNRLLKCCQPFHQFIVDMYAKIDTEILLYNRLKRMKLHAEEYYHLRDAIVNDGNVDNIGQMVILV